MQRRGRPRRARGVLRCRGDAAVVRREGRGTRRPGARAAASPTRLGGGRAAAAPPRRTARRGARAGGRARTGWARGPPPSSSPPRRARTTHRHLRLLDPARARFAGDRAARAPPSAAATAAAATIAAASACGKRRVCDSRDDAPRGGTARERGRRNGARTHAGAEARPAMSSAWGQGGEAAGPRVSAGALEGEGCGATEQKLRETS